MGSSSVFPAAQDYLPKLPSGGGVGTSAEAVSIDDYNKLVDTLVSIQKSLLGTGIALPAAFFALNPPIGTATSPVQGVILDWGGAVRNTKAPQNPGGVAKIDGSTNDAAAINGGLTLGGMVFQAAGTSSIAGGGNPILTGGTTTYSLIGAGMGLSIIKVANAQNVDGIDTGVATGLLFADFTIDGNKANQTTRGYLCRMTNVTKSVMRNVRAQNSYNAAIYIASSQDGLLLGCEVDNAGASNSSDGGTNAGISLFNDDRMRVIGCRVTTTGDCGIGLAGSGNHSDFAFLGNIVQSTYWIGIAGGTNNHNITATGNVVRGTVGSHGIDMGSCTDVSITANAIAACYGGFSYDSGARMTWVGNTLRTINGVGGSSPGAGWSIAGSQGAGSGYLAYSDLVMVANIASSNNTQAIAVSGIRGDWVIADNIFKNNGQNISTAGISLSHVAAQPMGNILIQGNKIYDDQVVKTQTYAVDIAAGTYQVSIINNDLRGNKNGAINDLGTATYTRGNLGYNPRGFLTAPAPAATGVILYNPFNCDCMVYINGSGAAALTAVAIGGIAAPVNGTHVALTTGGTLTTATYWYRVSALNPQGETLASTETSIAVTGPTGSVLVRWTAVPGATGYNVYGRTTGAELKLVSNVQATTFLDDGSITPSGALPGGDTTGNTALTGFAAAPANDSVIAVYLPWGNGIKVTYTTFVTANWQWFGL